MTISAHSHSCGIASPRLLQVFNQYLEPGGEEVWVNQMLQLGGSKFDIRELRFHSEAWLGHGAPSRLRQAILSWNHPLARNKLRQSVEKIRPEVLLYHNLVPVASLGMYEEARQLELPVIQYIHNFRPFSPSGTMWVRGRVNDSALHGNPWPEVLGRAWERSFLKTFLMAAYQTKLVSSGVLDVVRRWIAVSDFMRDRFIEAGIAQERIITLRHCWQPRLSPIPQSADSYYLFLGRLVPEKGVRVLIDAWAILENRLGKSCPRLVIAGSGPIEAEIQAASHRMHQVTCVGYTEGKIKDDLLLGCRALIAPSIWWEPLGLIVHEAYDAARPVLAAASGGLTETVIPGRTGFLHTPGDAEALANDVERVEAMSLMQRNEIGQNGREWLIQNANPQDWINQFTQIIQDTKNKT